MLSIVVLSGVIIIGIYRWINRNVLTNIRFFDLAEVKKSKKVKAQECLSQKSFGFLAKSKYIRCLAIFVLAYGIAINLIEVTWKSQLKLQYPNSNEYSAFMGYFSIHYWIWSPSFMMLFVGGNVMRRFGWGVALLITPVVLLTHQVSASSSFDLFRDYLMRFIAMIGSNAAHACCGLRYIQNIMSKSAKYSSVRSDSKRWLIFRLTKNLKLKVKRRD